MARHEACWAQDPDLDTKNVGQYYCSKCKLRLVVWYNQNYVESATGWYWEIRDSDNQIVDSAGNKYIETYEPAIGLLDDIKEEGLRKFESWPCRRSH